VTEDTDSGDERPKLPWLSGPAVAGRKRVEAPRRIVESFMMK